MNLLLDNKFSRGMICLHIEIFLSPLFFLCASVSLW